MKILGFDLICEYVVLNMLCRINWSFSPRGSQKKQFRGDNRMIAIS